MMKWPFVLRLRLEMAQQEIDRLKEQVAELKEANSQARALFEEEKELRIAAEARVRGETEETGTRRNRMFGSDIRNRATAWATERAHKKA